MVDEKKTAYGTPFILIARTRSNLAPKRKKKYINIYVRKLADLKVKNMKV